ncbi:hypothetical protein, partial [Enterobacter hormaechei]|uniref:hypothetical protein n=1 Tax=Enterobacter hormaechei TaxID=158836 RepID=UPI00204103E1
AVMGLSGAVLSFEDELLRAANPGFAEIAEHHADGQYGTGGDAQQPVQLEQDVLEHGRRRAWKAAARILRNSK